MLKWNFNLRFLLANVIHSLELLEQRENTILRKHGGVCLEVTVAAGGAKKKHLAFYEHF